MASGTIKKVSDKGFGFIAVDGDSKDLFFHLSGLKDKSKFDELQVGDKLEFDITSETHDNRPRAVNIVRIVE